MFFRLSFKTCIFFVCFPSCTFCSNVHSCVFSISILIDLNAVYWFVIQNPFVTKLRDYTKKKVQKHQKKNQSSTIHLCGSLTNDYLKSLLTVGKHSRHVSGLFFSFFLLWTMKNKANASFSNVYVRNGMDLKHANDSRHSFFS